RLLEEVFWASMFRDEGRQCRFTVAYYPKLEVAQGDMAIALEPQILDRNSLRRLSAVALAADTEIAVCHVAGEFRIIGLCKYLRMYLESASIPVEPAQRGLPIEIEVRGPAHIVVRYGIFRILTYFNGEIPKAGPNVLDVDGPFRDALDNVA